MTTVNLENIERDTTALHDGPFHGRLADRPNAKMRKIRHSMAFRMPEKDQPNKPVEEGGNGRVLFACYLWLTSDQRYCFVDCIFAGSEDELNQALKVLAE
jgi:hypothetical protein